MRPREALQRQGAWRARLRHHCVAARAEVALQFHVAGVHDCASHIDGAATTGTPELDLRKGGRVLAQGHRRRLQQQLVELLHEPAVAIRGARGWLGQPLRIPRVPGGTLCERTALRRISCTSRVASHGEVEWCVSTGLLLLEGGQLDCRPVHRDCFDVQAGSHRHLSLGVARAEEHRPAAAAASLRAGAGPSADNLCAEGRQRKHHEISPHHDGAGRILGQLQGAEQSQRWRAADTVLLPARPQRWQRGGARR
mmetsp:Transcript_75914/g.213838  ORF Transcript_75914/g.213838 Transcript_75914/m.213838 type:complete len:253 (-) Transcript_75914:417-1175(-)